MMTCQQLTTVCIFMTTYQIVSKIFARYSNNLLLFMYKNLKYTLNNISVFGFLSIYIKAIIHFKMILKQ